MGELENNKVNTDGLETPAVEDGAVVDVETKVGDTGEVAASEESLPCDAVLYSALCRSRHRPKVLEIEKVVENFVMHSEEDEFEFLEETAKSTFERLLVHRTAQHWGLSTRVVNTSDHQCSIIARKGEGFENGKIPKRCPLSDLKVTVEDDSNDHDHRYGGSRYPDRILSRERNMRGHYNSSSRPQRHAREFQQHMYPMMYQGDREEQYERAKARIFGGSQYVQTMPEYPPMMYPAHYMQNVPMEQPKEDEADGSNKKAQMRNKKDDMTDPDFKRHGGMHGIPYQAGGPYMPDQPMMPMYQPQYMPLPEYAMRQNQEAPQMMMMQQGSGAPVVQPPLHNPRSTDMDQPYPNLPHPQPGTIMMQPYPMAPNGAMAPPYPPAVQPYAGMYSFVPVMRPDGMVYQTFQGAPYMEYYDPQMRGRDGKNRRPGGKQQNRRQQQNVLNTESKSK
jgi:hypothetical protein